ncbi:FUSC family protein [Niveibacterium microcysteis]|uniref:FUSC family protein n=1 Tax=Niveibacterium microcysteis TaxID=2811415 RepID=A0ABX7M1B4_9RHOO|nr:FUSC family membrane protein [Niveibacterium microcysteis]QSI75560.1 FUSC family protein [Niveibacterium microcysteis]
MPQLPRLLFTHTIYNGIGCAAGVLLLALCGYMVGGFALAAVLSSGAMAVSIADVPAPEGHKLRQLLPAWLGTALVTLLVSASHAQPILLGLEITVVGFVAGLLSAWGRLLLPMGFSLVLATVFAMAFPLPPGTSPWGHAGLFMLGGLAYLVWGWSLSIALAVRTRQQVLADALDAFSRYLRHKARYYDAASSLDAVYLDLIREHAALAEKLQAARDFCFYRIRPGRRAELARVLYALLDAYEHALASQTDRELMRARYGDSAVMREMGQRVVEAADDIEAVAGAIVRARPVPVLPDRSQACAATQAAAYALAEPDLTVPEHARAAALLRGLAAKLFHSLHSARTLIEAARQRSEGSPLPSERELRAFVSVRKIRIAVLRRHLNTDSPVLRYALRLAMAMLTGFVLARNLPYAAHGHWILLTTAVVLRPSFSQTRQRHNDRVIGNLIGCVIAGLLLHVIHSPLGILPLLFLSIAIAHAFVTVQYRVTSIAACVMGLLQLQLLVPNSPFVLTERVIDTIIGALIALGFAFVLPAWERRSLPQLMKRVRETAANYADAALDPQLGPLAYRLARKQAQDALAALSQATARMLDEPASHQIALPPLHGTVSSAYLLGAQLASVRFMLDQRTADFDPPRRDALLTEGRRELARILAQPAAHDAPPHDPVAVDSSPDDMRELDVHILLQRRLAAAREDAQRLAGFAAA